MKKYLFLIASILLFTSMNEDYSQCCANPLDEVTITRTVTVGTVPCTIKITFCHNISPVGIRYIKICSITIPNGCGWGSVDLSSSTFWDIIYHEIMVYSDSIYEFPPCDNINQLASNVQITKAECWRIVNDYIALESKLVECDGEAAICHIEYVVCWNGFVLTKTELNRWVVGESDCYYEGGVFLDPLNPNPDCFDTCY